MTHDTDNHPTPEAAERARFEAWAKSQHYNLGRDQYGGYASIASRAAWAAWQAALAAQDGGGGERVTDDPVIPEIPAYLAEYGDAIVGWDSGYMSGWCDCLKAIRMAQEGPGNG